MPCRAFIFSLFAASAFLGAPWGALHGAEDSGPVTLEQHIRPLLKQYCYDCHNPQKQKGDLDLQPVGDNPRLAENRDVWEKIAELIESGEMPPEKKPQPNETERDLVIKYIDGELAKLDCKQEKNPGRVTIRRLNREEYRNTIRDLFGVVFEPKDFPNDAVGYGFDNIGDVLSLAPMLMEKYLAAAEEIVGKAIVADPAPKRKITRIRGDKLQPQPGRGNDAIRPIESRMLGLYREGEAGTQFDAVQAGSYNLRIRAYGEQAGNEPPRLAVSCDGRELQVFEVPNTKIVSFEVPASLEPGTHQIAVAYLNNYSEPNHPDEKLRGDRNLFVESVEIESPPVAPSLPEAHKRYITRLPQPGEERQVATEILGKFARRAYRRAVTDQEVARLTGFVDRAMSEKGTFLEGIQLAMQAALCSPHFLYRWELDPEQMKANETRALTHFEVASRLSYFLWSSMPDDELLDFAERGTLRLEGNFEKQVARMLHDPRADAFVTNFAGQWLQIRGLPEVAPDPELFRGFDPELRAAMKRESELLFDTIIKEDRPVTDLLDADFTFLNERLAAHYGIDGVKGPEFRRVPLPPGSPRGGVLTLGSVLTVTSTPTRTAPVLRGKWILEQILGTPPPAPPPDVPPLAEQTEVNQSASLRVRLEEHRSRADCAGCHAKMDPLGFALENFDAVGRWRDQDGKFPIDASGKLVGGKEFNGARELKALLKTDKRFVRGFAEKMMIYALGRGLDYFDRCAVDEVVAKMSAQNNRFSALVSAIVGSDPFLKRRPEPLAQN
jgi:mono/diheme cytochrome c family protein